MPDILIDGKLKSVDSSSQLFIVKDGTDIGLESEQPLITDIDQLDIKVKEAGFKDVRVTRLDDLYVSYIELLYEKDGETRVGIPGQYLGSPVDLTGVSLKVHFSSDSDIDIVKTYDVSAGTYKLCLRRGAEYIELSEQSKVTDSSKYFKYTFDYNGTKTSVIYDLFSVKDLISASVVEWNTPQYTATDIDTNGLKIRLTFRIADGTEVKEVYFNNASSEYVTCSLNKEKWADNGTSQEVEITCSYLNDEEYDFNATNISFTYTNSNIEIKCIDRIIDCTLSVKNSDEEDYFLSLPNLKCSYMRVHYNNGDEAELNATQRNKVSLYVPYSGSLHSSNDGLTRYIVNAQNEFVETTETNFGYTKEWHAVGDALTSREQVVLSYYEKDINNVKHYVLFEYSYKYTPVAQIKSIAIKNYIPVQYERSSFKTRDGNHIATYEVTYNNDYSLERVVGYNQGEVSIPKYDEEHDYYDYSLNMWNYYSDEPSVTVNITIHYIGQVGEATLVTPVTLIKKAIDNISNVATRTVFNAGSDIDLTALKVQLNYNNGEKEIVNPTAVKRQGTDEVLLKYDTFIDSDPWDYTTKITYYDMYYSTFSVSQDFILSRTVLNVQALKADDTTFLFSEEDHFQNRAVNIDKLNKFIINYSDESKYTLTFSEDDNKKAVLNNNQVRLYREIWGGGRTQVNYFIFNGRYKTTEENVEFTVKITSFKVTPKSNKVFLYQGKSIEDSLRNDFNYTITMLTGDGDTTQEKTIYDFDELSEYNAKIYCSSETAEPGQDSVWPLPESGASSFSKKFLNKGVSFKCVPYSIGDFDLIFNTEFNFYRVVESVRIKSINPSSGEEEYTTTYSTNEQKIRGKSIEYTASDMGSAHRVIFTNGYVLEDVEPTYLKKFVIENGLNKDITKWPESGTYYLAYDENELGLRSPYATVTCTNMVSVANSISATQKNHSRIAGQTIQLSDFDINVYGLCNEQIIPLDDSKLSISNNTTSSLDEDKLVNVSYTDPHFSDIKVSTVGYFSLTAKNCTISYEVYLNNFTDKLKATTAGSTSYTPRDTDQDFSFRIDTETAADSSLLYSYSELKVYDKDTDEQLNVSVTYNPSSSKMTIPAKLDKNLIIKIKMSSDYVLDEYGHAYAKNSSGVLIGFKDMKNAQGTYRIPNEIKTITHGFFNGSSSIKKLIIGNNLERINDQAFYNCTQLSEIKFEARSKQISIGQSSFGGCSSLTTLDFLSCGDIRKWFIIGTPDSSPISGTPKRNTWSGCKLRTIKIAQSSFSSVLRVYYLDMSAGIITKWLTGRCAGGFKLKARNYQVSSDGYLGISRSGGDFVNSVSFDRNSEILTIEALWITFGVDALRLKSLPKAVSSIGYVDGYQGNNIYASLMGSETKTLQYNKAETYTVETYQSGSSYNFNYGGQSYNLAGRWDLKDACALTTRSSRGLSLWLVCYGFGHWSSSTYKKTISDSSDISYKTNYNFTTNGRVGLEFVSVENNTIGNDFNNWSNSDYVNDCIYPNIKLNSSAEPSTSDVNNVLDASDSTTRHKYNNQLFGTFLDFMIPIYTK